MTAADTTPTRDEASSAPPSDIDGQRATIVAVLASALHHPGRTYADAYREATRTLNAFETGVRTDAAASALHGAARLVYNGADDYLTTYGTRFSMQSFYNEGVSPWLTDLALRAEMRAGEPRTHADLETFLREHGWTPGRRGTLGRMWTRDDRQVGVADGITPADPEWQAIRDRVDLITGEGRWPR